MHSENRARLVAACDGALIVLTGYDAMQGSGDMAAPFLQEGSFWWVTGIEAPGWKAIIDGTRGGRLTLVRPRVDEVHRIFDGELSDDEAKALSGAEAVVAADKLEPTLRQLARRHSIVQTIDSKHPYDFAPNPAPAALVETLQRIFPATQDCSLKLNELRAIKTPEEIKRMKQAINLTAKAFSSIRAQLATYKHEYEIEADFTQHFRAHNARHAYEPIVAAGKNACTLHYIKNSDNVRKNDLILIDIGANVAGYSADITRTYCLKPTKRQQAVHAAVRKAHQACIALIGPDVLVAEYFRQVDDIMKEALLSLGLLRDRADETTYRRYFPHSISHGLGIDPHDPLGRPRYLRPGMVLTVEPGIYIPEEGIGVRIEDDILVTPTGRENLSGHLSTNL